MWELTPEIRMTHKMRLADLTIFTYFLMAVYSYESQAEMPKEVTALLLPFLEGTSYFINSSLPILQHS